MKKPTDTHLHLHYTSAHHKPCHTKGPFGQFLRMRRIFTKNEKFIPHGIKLIEYYLKRGYPFKSLKKYILKASSFTQDELLVVKETIESPVMVTTYNPINPDIKGFIHNNWNILEHSNDCSETFKNKPLVGYKRLPNPRNLLTKAEIAYPLTTQDKPIIKPTICTRLGKCTYCPLIKKVSEVQCKVTHKITKITKVPRHIACELSDIVYLITCKSVVNIMWEKQGGRSEKAFLKTNCQSQNLRKAESPQSLNILLRRVILLRTCNFLCWNGVPSSITPPNLTIER